MSIFHLDFSSIDGSFCSFLLLYCVSSGNMSVSVFTSCSQAVCIDPIGQVKVLVSSETGSRWYDLAVYMCFWPLFSLTQGVQCRLTFELPELRERAGVCEWLIFNVSLSVSLHLLCGRHLSCLFFPASNVFISLRSVCFCLFLYLLPCA